MLLSIIIPTKNRYGCLKECITELIKIKSNELEIIIQDNTLNNDDISHFLNELKDSRIKYFHNQEKLSQTENSDLACKKAIGEYVCYIGDDDCVAQSIIHVVKYLKENRIDACLCNMASYYWADCVFDKKTSVLKFIDEKPWVERINIEQKLKEFYLWGCLDIKFLPRVYHAIISRKVLNDIYEKCGTYFPGAVPDMSNAVSASKQVFNCVFLHLPIIISGYSYNSGAGMGARGEFVAKLDSQSTIEKYHLSNKTLSDWHKKIPRIVDGYSLWTQSTIDALNALNRKEEIDNINFNALYARSILKYRKKEYIIFIMKNKQFVRTFKFIFRYMVRYFKQKINIKKMKYYINYEKISLAETCCIVNTYIHKNIDINFIQEEMELNDEPFYK